MMKPRILVTSAAGRTGSATVLELLEKGFPVRAFVHRRGARAEVLEKAGAELIVGDLFDMRDLRRALVDVQRAYYCPPFAPNLLHGSMLFALAAEEARLEVVALMSQWNPHSTHPSVVTREHWIANQLYRWMSTVDVIHLNPGLFAFIYLMGLPAIVHLGRLLAPFGEGRNAPPSNRDIARVAAAVLTDPASHVGRSYRPTGPELLSTHEIADVLTGVVGRRVKYQDVPLKMFTKAAKALGFPLFEISQMQKYAEDLRGGAFEIGAPTDHVEAVTGQKPERFEEIARRYVDNPRSIHPNLAVGSSLAAMAFMVRVMFTGVPDIDQWERERGHPLLENPLLAHESEGWRASAEKQQLNLLPIQASDVTQVGVTSDV